MIEISDVHCPHGPHSAHSTAHERAPDEIRARVDGVRGRDVVLHVAFRTSTDPCARVGVNILTLFNPSE